MVGVRDGAFVQYLFIVSSVGLLELVKLIDVYIASGMLKFLLVCIGIEFMFELEADILLQ